MNARFVFGGLIGHGLQSRPHRVGSRKRGVSPHPGAVIQEYANLEQALCSLLAHCGNMPPLVAGTIGKLAGQSGVKLETIRYYERIGLMPTPDRTESGHRLIRQSVTADGVRWVGSGRSWRPSQSRSWDPTLRRWSRRCRLSGTAYARSKALPPSPTRSHEKHLLPAARTPRDRRSRWFPRVSTSPVSG